MAFRFDALSKYFLLGFSRVYLPLGNMRTIGVNWPQLFSRVTRLIGNGWQGLMRISTRINIAISITNTPQNGNSLAAQSHWPCMAKYLHSHDIRLQWCIIKLWQLLSNECHWSRDGKIDIVGIIFRFSINIRIEVHYFALGNERTRVAG